ncbi:hypothetical protein CR513_17427, partial [Mucuna pruriens]
MLTNSSRPINHVNEQEWPLAEDMKCPNNQFYFVKSSTCGKTLTFSLPLTTSQDGWKLRAPRQTM